MSRARVIAEPLGAGPAPECVIEALRGREPVCLAGLWAGGGALLAEDPLQSQTFEAVNGIPELPMPEIDNPDTDLVGGGWFGWVAYSGTSHLAYYDHVLRWRDGQWWFEALWTPERAGALGDIQRRFAQLLASLDEQLRGAGEIAPFAGADRERHLAAVEAAVELIRAGEVYQVNVCTRLSADFDGDALALYGRAASELKPSYGAYLHADERSLVSLSPELFLRRRAREVTTSPIKGTRAGDVPAAELRESSKDAAENVMIVDLMRNDLGRVSEIGSVRPSSLLAIEAHPGLWHLVSTVTATLRPEVTDTELLNATFPPGSVTGAPKVRAVQAITELEEEPREVYTGAIGFISPSWGAEFNVAIRTFEVANARIELGVGGGVTADSVPMLEWREVLQKAVPLIGAIGGSFAASVLTPAVEPSAAQVDGGLLETILTLDGSPLRLADHLARLDRSSRELYGHGHPPDLAQRAAGAASAIAGRGVIRVVLAPTGTASVEARSAHPPPTESQVRLVHGRGGLWRHKWAVRDQFEQDEAAFGTPLYVASDGAVLETSRGNVVLVKEDGALVTPPLRDDLLPGITRRALLDHARDEGRNVELRTFGVEELLASTAFWTSSLSLAVPIAAVDGTPLPRHDALIDRFAAVLGCFTDTGQRFHQTR